MECWAALGGGYTAGPVSSIVYCEESQGLSKVEWFKRPSLKGEVQNDPPRENNSSGFGMRSVFSDEQAPPEGHDRIGHFRIWSHDMQCEDRGTGQGVVGRPRTSAAVL